MISPTSNFTYDSLYRLKTAEGREHTGLNNDTQQYGEEWINKHFSLVSDSNALANYTRTYQYDKGNNLYEINHTGDQNFTRTMRVDTASNRAVPDTMTGDFTTYFDENGNCSKLEHVDTVEYNYRDNISKAIVIQRPVDIPDDAEYYIYDSSGNRVRKITIANNQKIEKIYLSGCEIKRITSLDGSLTHLERFDHHVMDDTSRIAIVNRWTVDLIQLENDSVVNAADPDILKTRYQFGNHLGSASLELDHEGSIISYEEYFPFGGTSYVIATSDKEVKRKEYRFTGKERDEFTGLYYFGARYYAPWIGRWMSADPKRENEDGLNLYAYVRGNPVTMVDPNGEQAELTYNTVYLEKLVDKILTQENNKQLLDAILEKAQSSTPSDKVASRTIGQRVINAGKTIGKVGIYATSAVALDKVLVGPGLENELNGGMSEKLLGKSNVFGSSQYEYKNGKPSTENVPANVLKDKGISFKSNVDLKNIGSGYFSEDAKKTEVSNIIKMRHII